MSARQSGAARSSAPAVTSRRAPLGALPGGAPLRATRPRLQAVRAPLQARSRVPFMLLCMSILGGALLGALLLNTTMARGSYQMSELKREVAQVAQDTQTLATQVRGAESSLPERARGLGMVESQAPVMLRLSDGAVIGGSEAGTQP
jgi:outer membrane murein-binding lipoprotein Lpp